MILVPVLHRWLVRRGEQDGQVRKRCPAHHVIVPEHARLDPLPAAQLEGLQHPGLRLDIPAVPDSQTGEDFPLLGRRGVQLTCIPSRPADAPVPGYRLVLALPGTASLDGVDAAQATRDFDRLLGEANQEFAGKLRSGRLGASRPATCATMCSRAVSTPRCSRMPTWSSATGIHSSSCCRCTRALWEELGL